MFGSFFSRLTAAQPGTLPAEDCRLALTALLVRVARSDGYYDADEQTRILHVTQARYELSEADALTLRGLAETLEEEAPDTVRFTREIKDAVPLEDRVKVIEALWQVALADGQRDQHEDALLRLVSSMLGINDRDNALARQRVERSL
ncbi:TerB family tellurite resistance protein [uncultured Pelagimonas sp.]|uniref:tellurite resistance TerB family protein n=1 Tax=uncultured Pelagimonas sp. TaxID=1618102 RepID=UPI0026240F49|nr:TerB family tellurite resistance protein [uncultured Pelagimonas sp.]